MQDMASAGWAFVDVMQAIGATIVPTALLARQRGHQAEKQTILGCSIPFTHQVPWTSLPNQTVNAL